MAIESHCSTIQVHFFLTFSQHITQGSGNFITVNATFSSYFNWKRCNCVRDKWRDSISVVWRLLLVWTWFPFSLPSVGKTINVHEFKMENIAFFGWQKLCDELSLLIIILISQGTILFCNLDSAQGISEIWPEAILWTDKNEKKNEINCEKFGLNHQFCKS